MKIPGRFAGRARRARLGWWLVFAALAAGGAASLRAAEEPAGAEPGEQAEEAAAEEDEEEEKPAKDEVSIDVDGLGWWRDRELEKTVFLLRPEAGFGSRLDAAFVEDAVVLLQSTLERDGFLQPAGVVHLFLAGEPQGEYAWEGYEVPSIPRQQEADRVVFKLDPGVRYTFARLQFAGLTALPEEDARGYFLQEGLLFGGGGTRKFSPSILRKGISSLQEELVLRGYAEAVVTEASQQRDDATGRVDVAITVEEGPLHRVAEVRPPADVPEAVAGTLQTLAAQAAGERFTPRWRQEFLQAARRAFFARGYADATVRLEERGRPERINGITQHTLALVATTGPQVRVGAVTFAGEGETHESLLRRTTRVDPGELFDRGEVDQDRVRLGALGIFSSIETKVRKIEPDVWDVEYAFKPGDRLEVSLLMGYGSYEKLRGGVEVVHNNQFGEAHRGRLQLIYSQKSASGDYLYTVPQIFGTSTDVSARVFGLQREEVSFDRRDYGVSVGARKRINWQDIDAALRYQFESVNADITDPDAGVDAPTDSTVAALTLDLTRDKLDNPITPRRGLSLALALETATKAIGGDVDYQRLDFRGSWHRPVGRERFVHVGLRHGLIYALSGSSIEDIPLGKRFFPGGESTIRGYVEGRASPRNAEGTVIGAEVSTILNVEYEQGLAQNLSAVAFVDAGLSAASLNDYPGNETRVSVGLGIRYNTPIGPARLEYGHNVVREDGDGRDAWHLALGFPF